MEMEENNSNVSFKKQGDSEDFLDGFQQVFGVGEGSPQSTTNESEDDDVNFQNDKPTNLGDDGPEYPTQEEPEEEEDQTDEPSEEEGEEEPEEEEENSGKTGESEEPGEEPEEENDNSGDDGSNEEDIVDSFFDLFAQELGWEYDENNKPKSISGLVDFMNDIMQQGAQPQFASDEVKEINDYISNGGSIDEYLDAYSKDTDVENLDIDNDVESQKKVVRDHLKKQGFSDDNIENKIERYEDVGTLKEEAQESLGLLKEYNQKEKDKLLKEKENQRKEQEEKQQKIVEDVKSTIDNMDNVKGIPLTKKQKEDLKPYLLEVGKDGLTDYQRDYSKSYSNLIESAFFAMQGDNIVEQLRKKANTDATKKLKNRLNKSNKRSKTKGSGGGSSKSGGGQQDSALEAVKRMSSLLSSE